MTNRLFISGVFLTLSLVFLASCFDSSTGNTEFPSSFNVTLNVTDIRSDQFDGQNTAVVEEIKFTLGNIKLSRENSDDVTFNRSLIVANFSSENTDDVTIGTGQIAAGIYNGFSFEMLQPVISDQITDSDLVIFDDSNEITESFSIFISGTFNDEPFEYTTSAELNVALSFSQLVDMPEVEGNMSIRLLPQSNSWFRDENSRLFNPSNADSTQVQQINENITESFSVEVVVFNEAQLL